LLSILNSLRRGKARHATVPSSDLFRIDLGPVEEPMTNGRAERIPSGTTERIALGKAPKRAIAQPIGQAAERDFDWKSVQAPQAPDRWRDASPRDDRLDDAAYEHNGYDQNEYAQDGHAEDGQAQDKYADDKYAQDKYAEEPAPRRAERRPAAYPAAPAPPPAPRRAPHELADVIPEEGALTVQGVQKSFGSRMVVRGVSLALRRGEAVGLLGPNGAGKTTVFYMITGLIKADKGAIQFDGHDITHLPMYQRARLGIGYLPQEASIFRGLNVEDNIRAVLEVVEPNKKKREEELDRLLEEFNITRLRKTPSIALSGGERRRTEIARALATRPAYMLLDEPFAGIDPIAVGDIQVLVQHLKRRGIGVLITDHNVRETLGLTDRAYIIYSGEVLREGRADEIINDPEVRRLYLGEEFRM
jgi:lipopolysaccharide export system ATP-binding protein